MVQTLLAEVQKQLNRVPILLDDIDEVVRRKYINLGTSYDMEPFVDVVGNYYHIKVCERRVVVYNYKTSNVKIAAYIILEDYTYRCEYAKLEDRFKYSCNTEAMIREKQSQYFKRFDEPYRQYFERGISIFNLESIE